MNSRRGWSLEEDSMLRDLVETMGVKNWTEVSARLALARNEKPRTGKQCRERWHNHLNPEINVKKDWGPEEQVRLFALHERFGNKWTDIARQMPGRTDNAIKNYFYSTIRRSLRRMGKFVGSKNSTESMKRIKPSILSKIFSAESEMAQVGSMSPQEQQLRRYVRQTCEHVKGEIIRFTNFKPKRQEIADQQERNNFQKTIEKLEHINKVYEKIRANELRRRNEEHRFGRDYHKMPQSEQSEHCDDSEEEIGSADFITERRASVRRTRQAVARNSTAHSEPVPDIRHECKMEQGREDMEKEQAMGGNEGARVQQCFECPEFQIQLKDDQVLPGFDKHPSGIYTPGMQSFGSPGGFYFGTPSVNPFMFQSPEAPKRVDALSNLQNIGTLTQNTFDDYQVSLQRQIEGNLNGNDKKGLGTSSSTFGGSPGSAFRFCGN